MLDLMGFEGQVDFNRFGFAVNQKQKKRKNPVDAMKASERLPFIHLGSRVEQASIYRH